MKPPDKIILYRDRKQTELTKYVFTDPMQVLPKNPLNKLIEYSRILPPITGDYSNTVFYGDNNKYMYWFTISNGEKLLDVIDK